MTAFPNSMIEEAATKAHHFYEWLGGMSTFELGWKTCLDGHMMLTFILKLDLKLEKRLREYNPKIHEVALRAARRCLGLYGKPEPTLEAAIDAKERWLRMEIDSDKLSTYTADAFTVASEWKGKGDLSSFHTEEALVEIAKAVGWASSKNVEMTVRALKSATDVDRSFLIDRTKTADAFRYESIQQAHDIRDLFPYSGLISDTEIKNRFHRAFVI